ncbi:MAG: hypothetical protein ACRECP_03005 [Methylocella sp.]
MTAEMTPLRAFLANTSAADFPGEMISFAARIAMEAGAGTGAVCKTNSRIAAKRSAPPRPASGPAWN